MDGICQALANDAPLEGEIAVVVERGTLVGAPTHGTMVDDDVAVMFETIHRIVAFLFDVSPHARADETDNHVVGRHAEGVVFQANAVARSCLSGDGEVAVVDFQRLSQFDNAAHGKHDGARPFLADGPAERAFRAVVGQRSHRGDLDPGTARGVFSRPVGTGKGGHRRTVGHGIILQILCSYDRCGQEQPAREDNRLFHWRMFYV